MASVEPSWADTSVRWLRSHYPEYVAATSKRTFAQQLSGALSKMCYHRPVKDVYGITNMCPYEPKASDLAPPGAWGKVEHQEMSDFLKMGGYSAMRARERSAAGTITVETPDGPEELGIIMPGEPVDEDGEPIKPPAPMDEHDELQAALESHLLDDPRAGAW